MSIKPNERIMVIGGTGSGKTTLVAVLTLSVQHLAVYDVKRELGWLPNSVIVTKLADMTYRRREIYQPPFGMERDRDLFNAFIGKAYAAGHVMVWNDEASFTTAPSYLPPWLESVLVAGRSRQVGIINLTQSGVSLSNPMLWRSAEHTFVGYLNDRGIDSVATILGPGVLPARHIKQYSGEFLLFESNAKEPRTVPPVNLDALGAGYVRTGH